jgi:hypothetical protein
MTNVGLTHEELVARRAGVRAGVRRVADVAYG